VTYANKSKEPGREPVFLVDMYAPRCVQVYGTAPCTAGIGINGATRKCFNTASTCQDKTNYSATDIVYAHSNRIVREALEVCEEGERIILAPLFDIVEVASLINRKPTRVVAATLIS
jgi:hypothetical protein